MIVILRVTRRPSSRPASVCRPVIFKSKTESCDCIAGIFDTEPELDPWMVQGGLEITSPDPVYSNLLYPIVALDVQSFEESDWGSTIRRAPVLSFVAHGSPPGVCSW